MPPSVAEAQGLECVSKYSKSMKYGRKNPIPEHWNSKEPLSIWRKKLGRYSNQVSGTGAVGKLYRSPEP